MSTEIKKEIQLEIAHVLFIDIVGYSKLSINDQHAEVDELNQIVRASEQFQRAEAAGRLLKIPTGDGTTKAQRAGPRGATLATRARSPWLRGVGLIWQSVRRVCDCRSGSQRGGNHRGFDHLGIGRTCLAGVTAVDVDAIRTLSGERNGDGNQLLYFTGIAPSITAALSNAQKAFITSGASLSIFFSLVRFSLLYLCGWFFFAALSAI